MYPNLDNLSSTTDYLIQVAKGEVAPAYLVHKFGRNVAVANGAWELVAATSTGAVFPTAAVTVRVKAGGNAADTLAGVGARQVTVYGLDDSLVRASEVIDLAGASASSATSTKFWRIDRAVVTACGAYATPYNTAAITIEDSAGANDLLVIAAEEAQTQHCKWAVPSGYKAYLLGVDLTVDSVQVADVRLLTRENLDDTTVPVSARRLRHYWDGVGLASPYHPRAPDLVLPGPADIWIEAMGAGGATSVSASFELLVVSDAQ